MLTMIIMVRITLIMNDNDGENNADNDNDDNNNNDVDNYDSNGNDYSNNDNNVVIHQHLK